MWGKLLGWFAPYLLPAAGAVVVFSVLFGGYQKFQAERLRGKVTEIRAQWDAERVVYQAAVISAQEARAAETARRLKAYQEATDASEIRAKKARTDVVVAGSALERMRGRAEALAASCGAGISNPEPAKADAAEAGRVLADMLSRLGAFAGRVSEFADSADNDAQRCEAAAGALSDHNRR